MSYEHQESIANVIKYGGWTICQDANNLLGPMRLAVEDIAKHFFRENENKSGEFFKKFLIKEKLVSEFFDALNQSTELMQLQHSFGASYLQEIMKKPVLWTYPNIRVDLNNREKFSAPAHVDDWISFRGNKNIVVWAPLFGAGSLDVSPFMGKIEVIEDKYWGVKMKFPESVEWKKIQLTQSQILVFRNDLIHRSSNNFEEHGGRITAQLRY